MKSICISALKELAITSHSIHTDCSCSVDAQKFISSLALVGIEILSLLTRHLNSAGQWHFLYMKSVV